MANEEMIATHEFCTRNDVEESFLKALSESGLVRFNLIEQTEYISADQLPGLEKWVRLHYEMGINLEGIEAVHHLLEQIKSMEAEMELLKNRLRIYEKVE